MIHKEVAKRWDQRWIVPSVIILVLSLLIPALANAATLNQASVRLGRLGTSASNGNDVLVTFKLNTTPTSAAKIRVTFPSGFTVSAGTPTPSTTGFPDTPASITAPPGTLTSAANSGTRTIVVSGLTSASLNDSTLYGFIIPSGTVTNPATENQYDVTVESLTSGDVVLDSTTVPVYITGSGSNEDQVTVTASVAPNFSFSLSGNSDVIPDLDPSEPQTSTGVTMTVGTNSPLGYTAYVKSANGALMSAASGMSIDTGNFDGNPDTVEGGTTLYGFAPTTGDSCSVCVGSLVYADEYSGGSGAPISADDKAGSFNSTSFSAFVSRIGYTDLDSILLRERASVSQTIGYANDYTDTLTIIAAGNY